MRAKFEPKNIETLRPHLHPLIGYVADWDDSGDVMDQGRYDGQRMFFMSREDPRYDETECRWVPEEDLQPV